MIVVVPADKPDISPDEGSIVATDELELAQVPPGTPSVSVVVLPPHIDIGPAIGVGNGLTVTGTVT